jgi:hypothetical protein
MKRVLAGISAITLLATGLVGCGQVAAKLSFKDTVTSIASVEQGSGNLTFSFNSTSEDLQSMEINTGFLFDGLNVSIKTLSASSEGETYTLDDSIKFVDGNLYLNISAFVEDAIQGKDELDMPDDVATILEDYVSSIDWLEIPLNYYTDDYYTKYKAISNEISEAVGEAIEASGVEIQSLGTNSFEISAEDSDSVSTFIDPIYNVLADNKETYLNEYTELYNELDFNKLFNDYEDTACNLLDGLCTEFGIEFDEDSRLYIRDRMDAVIEEIDVDEIKSNLTDSLTETYDSILDTLKPSASDSEDISSAGYLPVKFDYKVSLTDNLSNQELNIVYTDNDNNEYTLSMTYELSAGLDTTISKPNSTGIADLAPTIANAVKDLAMKYAEDGDTDTEEMLDQYKGYTLYEILNEYGLVSNGEDEVVPYCGTPEPDDISEDVYPCY